MAIHAGGAQLPSSGLWCIEGQLVGIVSLRDILLHDLNEKDDEVRMILPPTIHSRADA